jgi:hypothetical protein
MPCTITGSPEGDRLLYANEDILRLTQMLCASLKRLEKNNIPVPKECLQWWNKHKKVDQKNG